MEKYIVQRNDRIDILESENDKEKFYLGKKNKKAS